MTMSNSSKKSGNSGTIGLALGGGAARGLAHIGVIRRLEEAGLTIDCIAGTSIGALIGAAYAVGISVDELENLTEELHTFELLKLFAPTFSRYCFISDSAIMDLLDSLYGDVKIEDLSMPFAAVATDFATGERVVFRQGKLIDAVRASISVPMVLRRVECAGRKLVDGGLVDPVPVKAARDLGAEFLVAVSVLTPPKIEQQMPPKEPATEIIKPARVKEDGLSPLMDSFRNFLNKNMMAIETQIEKFQERDFLSNVNFMNTLSHIFTISGNEIARLQFEINPPEVVICPNVGWINMWDFHKAQEAIEAGELAGENALRQPEFQAFLDEVL